MQEILADLKAARISYAEFLKQVAEKIIRPMHTGTADDTPEPLKKSPALRALYNQLERELAAENADIAARPITPNDGVEPGSALGLALRVDAAIRAHKPDAWRGVRTKELIIKRLIHEVVRDAALVDRLFLIVCAQKEY